MIDQYMKGALYNYGAPFFCVLIQLVSHCLMRTQVQGIVDSQEQLCVTRQLFK